MSIFYDGTELLSQKDINGQTPEIFITTSNRSAGKTTYFNRYFVKRFINNNEKFMLLYRYKYELPDASAKFFSEIQRLFYQGYEMKTVMQANGCYAYLMLNNKMCGYAVALNSADSIKKYSHFFSDTTRMLFDEFQPEDGKYCNNEIKKFQSIHTSVARGGGKQSRYVPVYMLANNVSIINPYYVALNVTTRIFNNSKFIKGDGFVIEQNINSSAKTAQEESLFNRAFCNSDYNKSSINGEYLNDNNTFINYSPVDKQKYLCSLKYDNCYYSAYQSDNKIFCKTGCDNTFPVKIAITQKDVDDNFHFDNKNFKQLFYEKYNKGCLIFDSLLTKDAIITFIK